MKIRQDHRIYAITPDAYGVYICSAPIGRANLIISELSMQSPTWKFFGYTPAARLTKPGGFTHDVQEAQEPQQQQEKHDVSTAES